MKVIVPRSTMKAYNYLLIQRLSLRSIQNKLLLVFIIFQTGLDPGWSCPGPVPF